MTDRNPSPNSEDVPAKPQSVWQFFTGQLPLQTETTFFILANALDIFWTYILIRYGAIEANPFANYVLQHWGFEGMIGFKLLIVAMVCVIAQIVALKRLTTAKVLLWGGTAVVGAVVMYSTILFTANFSRLTPQF